MITDSLSYNLCDTKLLSLLPLPLSTLSQTLYILIILLPCPISLNKSIKQFNLLIILPSFAIKKSRPNYIISLSPPSTLSCYTVVVSPLHTHTHNNLSHSPPSSSITNHPHQSPPPSSEDPPSSPHKPPEHSYPYYKNLPH